MSTCAIVYIVIFIDLCGPHSQQVSNILLRNILDMLQDCPSNSDTDQL